MQTNNRERMWKRIIALSNRIKYQGNFVLVNAWSVKKDNNAWLISNKVRI